MTDRDCEYASINLNKVGDEDVEQKNYNSVGNYNKYRNINECKNINSKSNLQ